MLPLNQLACPVCGARNMQIDMYPTPVFIDFAGDDYKYASGSYYCPVCSKDGMITFVRKAGIHDSPAE